MRLLVAGLLWAGLLSAVIVSADAADGPAATSAEGSPKLAVAVMVDSQTIEIRQFVERLGTRTTKAKPSPYSPNNGNDNTQVTEVASVIETQTTRMDLAWFSARRIDGRPVAQKLLADELRRPTAVIIATQGGQLDPLFIKMFKPETLILRRQPNARIETPVPAPSLR
jgi:hypothetical protein